MNQESQCHLVHSLRTLWNVWVGIWSSSILSWVQNVNATRKTTSWMTIPNNWFDCIWTFPTALKLRYLPAAKTIHQVEGSHVKCSGWVGGDAWFGSVQTCIELFLRFGVCSTLIVKNNTSLYSTEVLNQVLKSRHSRQAGHWVVVTATINKVNAWVVAYAWPQKGVSYFLMLVAKQSPYNSNAKASAKTSGATPHWKRYPDLTLSISSMSACPWLMNTTKPNNQLSPLRNNGRCEAHGSSC